MAILLEIMRSMEDSIRCKFVTCDCEIILHLYYNDKASAGDIFSTSKHSSTSFYSTLKRLAITGLIVAETDPSDKRSNIYRLSSSTRGCIDACCGSIAHLLDSGSIMDCIDEDETEA